MESVAEPFTDIEAEAALLALAEPLAWETYGGTEQAFFRRDDGSYGCYLIMLPCSARDVSSCMRHYTIDLMDSAVDGPPLSPAYFYLCQSQNLW